MLRVVYAGVDTLDVAFQGAFPKALLQDLADARALAASSNRDQALLLGPGSIQVLVKSHGQRGGFRYVFTTGPTGAIFSVKANANVQE